MKKTNKQNSRNPRTIFWNVDTQYDFMRADESFNGALPVPGARDIEPNLERLTQYACDNDVKVINTADSHTDESKELSDNPDFQTTFPKHCMRGTAGANYIPATKPDGPFVGIGWEDESYDPLLVSMFRNIVLYKDAFDVFEGNPHTDNVVTMLSPDRAVVYGVATNVCVDYAVRGLLERGVEVHVPTDAIKELPGLPLEATLKSWEDAGAKLTTVDEMLEYL